MTQATLAISAVSETTLHLQCMEVWGGNRAVDSSVALPGLDAWVFSKPVGGKRGGDVHYLSSCATRQVARMLVADVSGHGEVVARAGTELRNLMRRHVNAHDQRRLVRALNRDFTARSADGQFATAVAMTFNAPTNRLLLSNAGHPPPLRYHIETAHWSYLERAAAPRSATETNLPLGILDAVEYDELDVQLTIGDLVLCYTDSLPESKDESGEMLGREGVLRAVQSVRPTDFVGMVTALRETLGRISRNADDDVTALLVKPNGQRAYIPMKDYVLAPFRYLRAVARPYR
jgi:sigma-B regulation protein RsbU (phosphoserine phosphatase)